MKEKKCATHTELEELKRRMDLTRKATVFKIAVDGYVDHTQETWDPTGEPPVLREVRELVENPLLAGRPADVIRQVVRMAYLTGLKDGILYAEEGQSEEGFVEGVIDGYARMGGMDVGGLALSAMRKTDDKSMGIPKGEID